VGEITREVQEYPIRAIYFTQTEVQDIVNLMDGYLRLAFSKLDHETMIKNIDDAIWDTMQRAYRSLTEEL
jgi:hypothetical protein